MSSIETVGTMGKDAMDTSLKSFSIVTKGLQQVAGETTEFAKTSYEQSAKMMEQLFQSRSLDKVLDVQKDYATSACQAWISQATKLGEIYADMAKESCKPFETLVTSRMAAFGRTA